MTAACYAHSLSGRPTEEWEPLREHLERVAKLAVEFAGRFGTVTGGGAAEWGRVAGLWHDVGHWRWEECRRSQGHPISRRRAQE